MQQPASLTRALNALRRGNMIILTDDAHRENEGDFVLSAKYATPEAITFMIQNGGGLVCTPMTRERAQKLRLPLMVPELENTESTKCKFTVSVDARANTTTGISAYDRATTIHALLDDTTTPDMLARPGHIFPLIAEDGGITVRAGHTEASLELMRRAGLPDVAVICEILNSDGSMARGKDLERKAEAWNLSLLSIHDLLA